MPAFCSVLVAVPSAALAVAAGGVSMSSTSTTCGGQKYRAQVRREAGTSVLAIEVGGRALAPGEMSKLDALLPPGTSIGSSAALSCAGSGGARLRLGLGGEAGAPQELVLDLSPDGRIAAVRPE